MWTFYLTWKFICWSNSIKFLFTLVIDHSIFRPLTRRTLNQEVTLCELLSRSSHMEIKNSSIWIYLNPIVDILNYLQQKQNIKEKCQNTKEMYKNIVLWGQKRKKKLNMIFLMFLLQKSYFIWRPWHKYFIVAWMS